MADLSDDTLSAADFDRLARLINDRCGIQLPANKRPMLESRLRRRARALRLDRLEHYCCYLFEFGIHRGEIAHLINAVTTNKTDFFREPIHFDVLARQILPEFVKSHHRAIRVWSAACACGAEPYSLAMVLREFAARNDGFEFGILATDIDTEVLETARRGIYPRDMVEPVPRLLRNSHVMESRDHACDDVRISPELRAAVGFAQVNLMDSIYPVGTPMDVIFCRNVLIYFNKVTQVQVVSKLVDQLQPGGYLFLGHSEGAAAQDDRLTQVFNTIYRRNPS